jgi:hypothetical protein
MALFKVVVMATFSSGVLVDPECTFQSCPVCLPEAVRQSRNLSLLVESSEESEEQGTFVQLPFRIGRCSEFWDTNALLGQLVGILAQEKFGISVEYVHADDETRFFLALSNCKRWWDEGVFCDDVVHGPEESQAAYNAGNKRNPDAAPDIMWSGEFYISDCCEEHYFNGTDIVWLARQSVKSGIAGFISLYGLYVYKDIESTAISQGVSLGYYTAYGTSNAMAYFDTAQVLIDAGDITHEIQGCVASTPGETTKMQQLISWGWSCVGGWWLTPSCAQLGSQWTQECIPVLDDSWSAFKPDTFQGMAESGMRMAKATLGYDLYYEIVHAERYKVTFCWWSTDSQFADLNTVKIGLPWKYESRGLSPIDNLAWAPLLMSNDKLRYLLMNVQLRNVQVDSLMKTIAQARSQNLAQDPSALYQKVACDFLRAHRSVWETSWLPDPRSCALGDYYDGSSCKSCRRGTFGKSNVLDGTRYCEVCPSGKFLKGLDRLLAVLVKPVFSALRMRAVHVSLALLALSQTSLGQPAAYRVLRA